MALRAAMVLTTIADPVVLEGYCANFAAHGHLEQIQVIVIPDRKTLLTVFLRGFIWTDMTREYFHSMAASMRAWVAACRQLAAV